MDFGSESWLKVKAWNTTGLLLENSDTLSGFAVFSLQNIPPPPTAQDPAKFTVSANTQI